MIAGPSSDLFWLALDFDLLPLWLGYLTVSPFSFFISPTTAVTCQALPQNNKKSGFAYVGGSCFTTSLRVMTLLSGSVVFGSLSSS
jgi:hypothetical protein